MSSGRVRVENLVLMASFACIAGFVRNQKANIAITFGLTLPVLLMGVGAAIDYGNASAHRSRLQAVADSAALAAAKELRLAGTTDGTASEVARRVVAANDDTSTPIAFEGAAEGRGFRVKLRQEVPTFVMQIFEQGDTTVAVEARANVLGGAPVCLLGLNATEPATVAVADAKVTAPKCTIYSNSTAPDGLTAASGGQMKAAFICSSGGAHGGGGFSPNPQLDCPGTPDPLQARPAPTSGGCDHHNFAVKGGLRILFPGTYCGGLKISGLAIATLTPGIYVIKDGPLVVADTTILTGVGTGFYLTGANATFDFQPGTTVNLAAPIAGAMAGMLFFEDRAAAPGTHRMQSRNAPVLLGTFYLPKSTLHVGAPGGPGLLAATIGALSAWTIIVADRISINDKLNLTLNTDYQKTKVPVPDGVGPYGASVVLSK